MRSSWFENTSWRSKQWINQIDKNQSWKRAKRDKILKFWTPKHQTPICQQKLLKVLRQKKSPRARAKSSRIEVDSQVSPNLLPPKAQIEEMKAEHSLKSINLQRRNQSMMKTKNLKMSSGCILNEEMWKKWLRTRAVHRNDLNKK